MAETIELKIIGKVQGVWYRQSTQKFASDNRITGIVQNMIDGSVRVVASGSKEQLNKLQNWCKQGPPMAKVDSVISKHLPFQSFEKFFIL